jgi:outer membrane receptor protein involved in Fe transport
LRVHFEDTGDPVQGTSDAAHAQRNPNHWLTLQGRIDLPRDQTLDLTLRHVGALGALAAEKVSAYTVLDANFSRRFSNHFELSLAISDLFNEHHTEFNSDRVLSPYGYGGRRAVLTGRWQF